MDSIPSPCDLERTLGLDEMLNNCQILQLRVVSVASILHP